MPTPCNKSSAFVFLIYQLTLILSTTPSYSIVFSTWFGISSVSLQWFTSYLSFRTSTVAIPPRSSPPSRLTCRVPQGSVLGPVIFNVYTTPLRSLIGASSISHLLYAEDTQLFISFVLKNFSSAINNLQSTIALISSWMSSNYLTLNPSKTKFLLIGLTQQTSKIVNPSLSLPTTKPIMPSLFAKISVSYLTRHCLSANRFHPSPAPVITIFAIFAASDALSIPPPHHNSHSACPFTPRLL